MPIDVAWDLETFPNIFTFEAERIDNGEQWSYEISDRVNDSHKIIAWLKAAANSDFRLVGYNSLGFDYPIIHLLYQKGAADAVTLYNKAMDIIKSDRGFGHQMWDDQCVVPQLDLFKIWHYDNVSKSTSLKMLEFNMRSDTIEDLPFPPGTILNHDEMDILKVYNKKDVEETIKFYHKTLKKIAFREDLSIKYGKNFLNFNDVKIGSKIMEASLENAGIQLRDQNKNLIQTPRPVIKLSDAILPWIKFDHPEFTRILNWLKQQEVTETKGVFKGLSCTIDGFQFDFGLGGIHGSVSNRTIYSDGNRVVELRDVASYYPNLAIHQKFYPEHLRVEFCNIFNDIYEERKKHPKGSPENAAMKLALNGTYGKSNDKYSPFYDPLFTMKITLNGQLLLALLAEKLMQIPNLEMLMINTDGIAYICNRSDVPYIDKLCKWWESTTGLELETDVISRYFARDCNNYIMEFEE